MTTQGPKFKDQEVRVNIFLPVGTILTYDQTNSRDWITTVNTDRDVEGLEGYIWKMTKSGELECLDCPEFIEMEDEDDTGSNRININENGIDININDNGDKGKIIINENGIDIDVNDNGESFKMKLDENGVKVNTNDSIN